MGRTIQPDRWVRITKPCQASINGGSVVTSFKKGDEKEIPGWIAEVLVKDGKAVYIEGPSEVIDTSEDEVEVVRKATIVKLKEEYGVEMDPDTPMALLNEKEQELIQEKHEAARLAIIDRVKAVYGIGLHPNSSLETLQKKEAALKEKASKKD